MEVNTAVLIKDGDASRPTLIEAPSSTDLPKHEGIVKKKRRRGKSKRNIRKPFTEMPWLEKRKYEKSKRNNRFRKLVVAKTHAPFNNNQFLMEIHKPEPENTFHILMTPSARTRDSSFSVDSEDNYFFSLPEDEEEYLTKEFSSVYEDAQSERLSNMSKNELIQEYLLLEAKYDNLIKRTERAKPKFSEEENDVFVDKDTPDTEKDHMITDHNTSGTSTASSAIAENSVSDFLIRLKEQEDQIHELQVANDKLQRENEVLRQKTQESSSEDSESDSSSTSNSDSSSNEGDSPVSELNAQSCPDNLEENHIPMNGQSSDIEVIEPSYPLVNGFHSPNE